MCKYINQNVRFAKRSEKNRSKVPIASASGKRVHTYSILQKNKIKEVEKHIAVMESKLNEIRDLISTVQEIRLEREDSVEDVEKWSTKLEKRMECYDNPIEQIQSRLKSLKKQDEDEIKEKEYEDENRKMKFRYEEEKNIEEMKLHLQNKNKRKTIDKEIISTNIKLPKLVITKFESPHLDWLRFWSQYDTEIDKSNLSAVGKFSYLKELLNPRLRALIDGLPFNTEGYERAKNILVKKFGKQSEVVNAHIQSVMNLPTIQNYQLEKIHEFYEKLTSHIQALQTLGKLNEINGYMRNTLNRIGSN